MSRARAMIAVGVVIVFVVAGGILIYATTSHSGQNVTINLNVTGGTKMNPDNPTAHQNDKVTINVTSDTDGEVHLHGYDIHFHTKAAPGPRCPNRGDAKAQTRERGRRPPLRGA